MKDRIITKGLIVGVCLVSINIGVRNSEIFAAEISKIGEVRYSVTGQEIGSEYYNIDPNSYIETREIYDASVLKIEDFTYKVVDDTITILKYNGSETEVIIPSMIDNKLVTVVGRSAFYECDTVSKIELPNTITTIEATAFGNCINLEYINIPEGITAIKENTFQNCIKLKSITIPEGVTYLGGNAFSDCISLDSIIIPQSTTDISWNPFTGCTSLQNINIAQGNQYFKVSEGVLYNIDGTALIAYPAGRKDTVFQISNHINTVGKRAFQGAESLKHISVSSNVKNIADNAFVKCTGLEAIDVDSNNDSYMSQEGILYNKQQEVLLAYPAGKQEQSFSVLNTVKSIQNYAFVSCSAVEHIEMTDSVKEIGDYSFSGCENLNHIRMSNNLETIGMQAFAKCYKLSEMILPNSVVSIGTKALVTGSDFSAKVFEGSYAHSYVIDNNISFEIVSFKEINNFIIRFYESCMGRTPDESGLNYWSNLLATGSLKGSDFAAQFIHADEFTSKNLNNDGYIDILYSVFFGRLADEGGMQYWLSNINQGLTRDYVLAGFVNSPEFNTLCEDAGITRGSMILEDVLDQNPDKTKFVHRFYTKCMGRTPDSDGLTYWVQGIVNGQFTGRGVADFFVNAQEFADKNLSDSDFVSVMYTVFFDRAADEGGKSFWMQQLSSGKTRNDVFNGFVDSKEFMDICSAYGINHH